MEECFGFDNSNIRKPTVMVTENDGDGFGLTCSVRVCDWTQEDVYKFLTKQKGHSADLVDILVHEQGVDGRALLLLNEEDLKTVLLNSGAGLHCDNRGSQQRTTRSTVTLGALKRLLYDILQLQLEQSQAHRDIPSVITMSVAAGPVSSGQGRGVSTPLGLLTPTTTYAHGPAGDTLHQSGDDDCSLSVKHAIGARKRRLKHRSRHVVAEKQPGASSSENEYEKSKGQSPRIVDTPTQRRLLKDDQYYSSSMLDSNEDDGHAAHFFSQIDGGNNSAASKGKKSAKLKNVVLKNGNPSNLKPELCKALLAMAYVFVVTWITALVMVIVHDRVPDMEKYPPLPDLFLDNMPHIPWAFEMCEVTGTVLFCIWVGVLFFHKHRFILLRRFFALSGTVFLLRCFTMLITSLSVPGTHLQCNPRVRSPDLNFPADHPYGDWVSRLYNAYLIWKGAGMSIQGVRTCGDYMFSGHTVALTMLNFFVTEYTTRRLYFIHTFSWLLNMFGIFFILAAHEHYSIDVFIAFYITSRLFLYYHTLANNQALMARDSKRTKVWFPLFSYFESEVDCPVPNQYEWPITPRRIKMLLKVFLRSMEYKLKEMYVQLHSEQGVSRVAGLFGSRKFAFLRPIFYTAEMNSTTPGPGALSHSSSQSSSSSRSKSKGAKS